MLQAKIIYPLIFLVLTIVLLILTLRGIIMRHGQSCSNWVQSVAEEAEGHEPIVLQYRVCQGKSNREEARE